MSGRPYSRRETIKLLTALPAISATVVPKASQRNSASARKGRVRLGGPLPGAGSQSDPLELARAAKALGYGAMNCPRVELADKERLRAIEAASKAEDVVIAEVGAFGYNMMARDAEERKKALDVMCEKLTIADEVGARCAVNISGFRGPDAQHRPHPENLTHVAFDITVENVRHIVDAVKPKRAKFTVECMSWIVPDGPDSYVDLIKAVGRSSFAVHFDPVNIINSPRRHFENGKFLEECFAKLGKWIMSCHGKDTLILPESITHINEGRPGTGILDWKTFLRGVAALPNEPPIIMEHLRTQEEYLQARDYIFAQGKEIGISF